MKKTNILEATKNIKKEKPYYFVSINGNIMYESESFTECKKFLRDEIRHNIDSIIENDNLYEYYIGMYSIALSPVQYTDDEVHFEVLH